MEKDPKKIDIKKALFGTFLAMAFATYTPKSQGGAKKPVNHVESVPPSDYEVSDEVPDDPVEVTPEPAEVLPAPPARTVPQRRVFAPLVKKGYVPPAKTPSKEPGKSAAGSPSKRGRAL